MKRILFVITFLTCALVSWAYNIEVKNADGVTIYYNFINDGKELEVTLKMFKDYSGTVVIPEIVKWANFLNNLSGSQVIQQVIQQNNYLKISNA